MYFFDYKNHCEREKKTAPHELNDVMKVHFTWTFEQIQMPKKKNVKERERRIIRGRIKRKFVSMANDDTHILYTLDIHLHKMRREFALFHVHLHGVHARMSRKLIFRDLHMANFMHFIICHFSKYYIAHTNIQFCRLNRTNITLNYNDYFIVLAANRNEFYYKQFFPENAILMNGRTIIQ